MTTKTTSPQKSVRKKPARQNPLQRLRERVPRTLHPDLFYRQFEGPNYFGLAPAMLQNAINRGEVPAPIALTDTGRAKGWFGRTIIRWQLEREATAQVLAKKTAAEAK
jgi:hypothetical protein